MSVTIDVSTNSFILNTRTEDANKWLNDNVGKLIHDDPERAYGENWFLESTDALSPLGFRWMLTFDNPDHAAWFLLRWS